MINFYKLLRQNLATQEVAGSMLGLSRFTIMRREADTSNLSLSLESYLAMLFISSNELVAAKLLLIELVLSVDDKSLNASQVIKYLESKKDYNEYVKPHLKKLTKLEKRWLVEQIKGVEKDEEETFWLRMEFVLRAIREHRKLAAEVILKRLVREIMIQRPGIKRSEVLAVLRDKHDYMIAVKPHLTDLKIREVAQIRFEKLVGLQR